MELLILILALVAAIFVYSLTLNKSVKPKADDEPVYRYRIQALTDESDQEIVTTRTKHNIGDLLPSGGWDMYKVVEEIK